MFSRCNNSGKSISPLRSLRIAIPPYFEIKVPATRTSSIGLSAISHGKTMVGNPNGLIQSFQGQTTNQNIIPKKLRECFLAPESKTISLKPFSVRLWLSLAKSPTLSALTAIGQSNSFASAETASAFDCVAA